MTGRNIARYVRCNQLIPVFKEMLDDGSLTLVSGVELSFLSDEEQELVSKVLEENGVRVKGNVAKKLKAAAGDITEEMVRSILTLDQNVTEARKKGSVNVKVPADVYHRYFSEADASEVQKILVEALGLYFMSKGE